MTHKYLGFPIPESLQRKIDETLANARAATDLRPFAMDLYDIIEELSEKGLEFYFIQPLKKANISVLKIKAIEFAMNTGQSAVLSIGKGLLKAMDSKQLMVVVELIENSLTVRPTDKDAEA